MEKTNWHEKLSLFKKERDANFKKYKKAFKDIKRVLKETSKKNKIKLFKRNSKHEHYVVLKGVEEVINGYNLSKVEKDMADNVMVSGYNDFPFKIKSDQGYIILCDHNFHQKRAEHRYVMDIKEGRRLERHELVHHIDENKENNDASNLMVVSSKEHGILHRKK